MNIHIILMNINEILKNLLKYQYSYCISLLFSKNKAERVTHYRRGTVLHAGTYPVGVGRGGLWGRLGHWGHVPLPRLAYKVGFFKS